MLLFSLQGDIYQAVATDADEAGTANSEVTYTLSALRDWFTIDGAGSITLKAGQTFDYEETQYHLITITARDNGTPSLESAMTLNITITDVNDEAPVFEFGAYAATPAENSKLNIVLFTVQAKGQRETLPFPLTPTPIPSYLLFPNVTYALLRDAWAIVRHLAAVTPTSYVFC